MTPLVARDVTAAKLLDMKPEEFRRLVEEGALPPPGPLGRWDVAHLRCIKLGIAHEREAWMSWDDVLWMFGPEESERPSRYISPSEWPPAKPLMYGQESPVYWAFVRGLAQKSGFVQVQRTRGNCPCNVNVGNRR